MTKTIFTLLLGFAGAAPVWGQDIVLLNDVHGHEVEVAASDLIRAYQKYSAAKAKEAKTNAPLANEQAARSYARTVLYYSEAQADLFAKPYADLPDAKERLAAHQAWYHFARRTLYLNEAQAFWVANQKCELLNSKALLDTYSENYHHARTVLYRNESQSMAYAEEMLKKVSPK